MASDGRVFVEAIIWADTYIIGYALLEIVSIPDSTFYTAVKVKTEYFPKKDGEYVNIAETDVRTIIENCMNKRNQ